MHETLGAVAGRTKAHEEAVETVAELGRRGYSIMLDHAITDEYAGIVVCGASNLEPEMDNRVERLRWEIREVLCAASAVAVLHDVERRLSTRLQPT